MAKIHTNRAGYKGSTTNNLLGKTKDADNAGVVSINTLLDEIMTSVSAYDYPRESEVPAGYYFSEVASIAAKEKLKGNERKVSLEVCYDIEGYDYKNRGQVYKIKQSYPKGSGHLLKFFKAMANAGVDYETDPENVVGTLERIHLVYDSDYSEIGNITARVPYWPEEEEEIEEAEEAEESEVESEYDYED